MAYCSLVGFAYGKKMLAKATVEKNMAAKEYCTYMVEGKAVTQGYDEAMAKKHAYAKTKIMGNDKKLFCIQWDMLLFNDSDKSRMEESLLATGCFIV
jgi:hypothetical protein